MRLFLYVGLLVFCRVQGNDVGNSLDEQCIYSVNKYKYMSKAIFQYVPTTIIDQTTLNILADVYHYQFKSPCNQSFIKLHNLTINPYQNDSLHTDTKQLEKSILQIFIQSNNILYNSTKDLIFSEDYQNNTTHYRRIKTSRTNAGRFIENSIFANYLLNKLLSPTNTTCEILINLDKHRLENSTCQSTTAGLLTIDRQINFVSEIWVPENETFTSIPLKNKTKTDFDLLLKQICLYNHQNSPDQLINMLNNELNDDDLNEILFQNLTQYSYCEWTMINRSIIQVTRPPSTEYILQNFSPNPSLIEYHFDLIERKANDHFKPMFKKYLNHSCQISNLITLRMLIFIAEDNLTIQCGLNRNNHLQYRAIAFRLLNNPKDYHHQLRMLLNNEQESPEIRILAFQILSSLLNSSEITHLIETIQSNQLRFYIKSLFKQSSIWLANSGSYQFPFGTINVLFKENSPSIIPQIIQFQLANNMEIDIYLSIDSEILLVFDRKLIIRFSTMNDLFQWINNDRLFEMKTLEEFYLKISCKIDFNQLKNFFRKSAIGIVLKIQHGLGDIITGYEISFTLQSNFQINIHQSESSTSYIWRSIQKENILFKIEQIIQPLVGHKQIALKNSSTKDFCYLIPHFDSKICLSFHFERFWPSSIAIRLLSDDPSLIYNFTSSNDSLLFHIQQSDQIFRSYRLIRKYHEHSSMPYYLEFSTPTMNYTSFIYWQNSNLLSFDLFNKNRLIANGSGVYQYDLVNKFSVNLTEINPKQIGNIYLNYNGNLTINAPEFLGGEFNFELDRFVNWENVRIKLEVERMFFFLKQNFFVYFYYNIAQSSFNLTFLRNQNNQFQWILWKNNTSFNHLLMINTSLIEFNHHTQGEYMNSSNMNIQSSSLINGWSLWNMSGMINNAKQIQVRFNRVFLTTKIDNRTLQLEMNYLNQRLLRLYFHINQSNFILVQLQIPGYSYESEGRLAANYTNFSLDFPITENHKKHSQIHLEFSSLSHHLILNLTSNIRHQYFFLSLHNLTFNNKYLCQSNLQSSLKMLNYQLFSFHSFAYYLPNSTNLQSLNGSFTLPSLFVSQPFLWNYKKDSQLLIQVFEWANFTRTTTSSNLSTLFGLQVSILNNFSRGILLSLERTLFGKRYLLIFELDRHWMISIILNHKIRYEFLSSPLDSVFLIQRIDLTTNQTHQLPINYYTDNQTLLRIEILFSKYFSTFLNDLILDLSLKNQTLKFFCYLPLFKREFFSLTWKRSVEKEFFHFSGLIEMKFLRKRRWIDYEYNYNLASIRFWTFHSKLSLFSLEPIQWKCNFTNDYLWNGKWAIDFRLMFGDRRELIRFNHKYHYTTLLSNLIFDLHLMNSHYDLDFNYDHLNHSIQGLFIKNNEKHEINGYWNTTGNSLQLNTQQMRSITIITSTWMKSIIDLSHEKIGLLVERTTSGGFRNDTDITECNPYLTIQSSPQLFLLHYYTLNDGLSTMIFAWSTDSYFSWNYTGHSRMFFPITKFELDLRTKYIFRLHTSTFKYSSIYNSKTRQLTIRREPTADDADDRYELKIRIHPNQTFLIHLQVINNHYEIIGIPDDENFYWNLHGYFRDDQFNGSLSISNSDWLLSSKLNFNSSFYISTGRYVQLIPTSSPQIAFEILLKSRLHLVFQYSGLRSFIVFKFFHHSSNLNLYFSSKSINDTTFNLNFQLNNLINQSWTLQTTDKNFSLYNHNSEFLLHGSLQDFSFQHFIENRKNEFFINENTIQFITHSFGMTLSNLSSETTRYIHVYHQPSQQNLTIYYYKSGRFFRENFNIQTPIYDINLLYYPLADENRYVKIFFEFLPLQMSAFTLVRGRTFRIGYETKRKQCILSGNLAFGIEDIDNRQILNMNERWKFIYGMEKREKIYLKWNIKINLNKTSFQGRMTIQDPNEEMAIPIYSDIQGYLQDMILVTNIRTIYSSAQSLSKPILLQLSIDQRILTQQYFSLKLIHEPSQTNLSFTIDHYPHRKLLIRLKPTNFSHEKTLLHLYANSTTSQLKLLLILANQINFNLTLPKSYPETGLLHSSLFLEDKEYFDGRLDTIALKFRSEEYLLNISFNQLVLQKRFNQQILASIFSRWIERNSSTALITIFSQTDFQRISVPIWQSAEQKTWLNRFKQFLLDNNFTTQFKDDLQHFFSDFRTDFLNEQGQFGVQLINSLHFDEDLQLGLQRINSTIMTVINTLFQLSIFGETLLQEYLNNLSCLTNHRNLLHLDISQLVTLTINSFIYETISLVNKTLIIFNHFTHYPRSLNAILSYLSNELILNTYKFLNNFYSETKNFFLSKVIQYSYDLDFLLKISPLLSNSITFFSSNDLRTIIYLLNERLRRILSIWLNSPLEYKIIKTITNQLIEVMKKLRFYLDDKLDFLLPILKISSPPLWMNNGSNQTFLLTWSKQYNSTNMIPEE